jgi:hypothetical protein
MENAAIKLEQLFLKAGQTHYYQYIITLLFTLEFCCTHFLNYSLPYLERVPVIYNTNSNLRENFDFDICNNTNYTMKINWQASLVNEFGIYCNKTKIYFLGLCFYFGEIIGSCISFIFIDRIGRKVTIFIFIPISILLMGAFKFMKASYSHNWIYGIYVNLFLIGFSNYIIVVDMLIYICEIVQQTKIIYFVMIIVTGSAISGLICSITFQTNDLLNWRNFLLICGGVHLLVYICLLFFLIDSPMFALNDEHFEDFSKFLRQIASRNGKILTLEDFAFLAPYMSKSARNSLFKPVQNQLGQIVELSASQRNSDTNESKSNNNTHSSFSNTSSNINLNLNYENLNNLNQINNDKNLNYDNDIDKEVAYPKANNKIFTNKIEYAPQRSIFVKNPVMKDIYLLSIGEDTDVPVKSLFGESKMRDFTPFDLLKFQSQIKNFLILTFIWIVTNIIRTGINFRAKYSYIYQERLQYPIINFGLDICLPFFLLIIYYNYQYSIKKVLISSNLIQFIFFVFAGFFIQKMKEKTQLIFAILAKVFCHVVYLVMCVITCNIYPILIRTKGVGFNIGFSGIGAIISIFLTENLSYKSLILYFILFNFFSIIICYELPNRIGTLLLDYPKIKKEEEDEDDVKLGDICIENAILVKPNQNEISDKVN